MDKGIIPNIILKFNNLCKYLFTLIEEFFDLMYTIINKGGFKMQKKILITYASYGSGHRSAARYIENYFVSQNNDFDIKLLDLSDYNTKLGKIGETMFNFNFNHNLGFWFTLIYKLFDHKISTMPYRKITEELYNQRNLKNEIKEFNPDITISTHFFGSILIAKYNKEGITNSKIITVLTDYQSHELWTRNFKNEDALIVSNEIIKNDLVERGFDKNKIYPFGIPLSEKFKENLNKEQTYKKYKLDKSKKIISFLNSSAGSMLSYDYLKIFLKKRYDVQTIMFCGKNEKVKEKCENLVKENNYKDVLILPFTTDVNNLLNVSSVVVSKPGGLSTTECLELKKPMILIPGNGGPENYNAKFLTFRGYAIRCNNQIKFSKSIKKVMTNPNILYNIEKNLSKYGSNTSVIKLYKLTNKLLNQKRH